MSNTLTLQVKNARGQLSGWTGWQSSYTGVDYISEGNNAHVVFRLSNALDSGYALNALTFTFQIYSTQSLYIPSEYCTLKTFLYTSDPTTSSPTSPPSGYIASYSASTDVTASYMTKTASFSFSATKVTYLYVWVTIENNHPQGTVNLYNNNDYVTGSYVSSLLSATAVAGYGIDSVSPSTTQYYDAGDTVTFTCTPVSGGGFDYWYDTVNQCVVSYDQTYTFTMPNYDVEYRAIGHAAQYMLKLEKGANIIATSHGTIYPEEGNLVAINCTLATDTSLVTYSFDGWYENGVKVSSDKNYIFYMPGRSMILTAVGIANYKNVVRLYNNTWKKYQVYIYKNGQWKLALPYVRNSNSWKEST